MAMQAGYKGFNWNVMEEQFDKYVTILLNVKVLAF